MDRYKVAIVDDDELSLDNLVFGLQKFENFHLEGTARNGVSGKKLIAKVRPDLLFLDVELPDMRGMDLLDSIRESLTWGMKVVFYTAYDKYIRSMRKQIGLCGQFRDVASANSGIDIMKLCLRKCFFG